MDYEETKRIIIKKILAFMQQLQREAIDKWKEFEEEHNINLIEKNHTTINIKK